MDKGVFFFIREEFFIKYDLDGSLMKNKGNGNKRPCFYAFQDKNNSDIYWCVPISSRVEKYESIVQHKILRQKQKGNKNPKCNTIRFSEVLGQKRAFLIQNMFPITSRYIDCIYMEKDVEIEVRVSKIDEKDIIKNAKEVQKLVFNGYSRLIFNDVQKIYNDLMIELDYSEEL
ncbi:MAG: type III toxin-antitoxin system CptIN family toxin [Anaerorhabdus sp.]